MSHGTLRGVAVLVTGATGFLGSHLTRRLVAEGARVNVMVRAGSRSDRLADVLPRIVQWTADLADGAAIARCVAAAAPRVVFHMAGDTAGRSWTAAGDPDVLQRSYDLNLGGTLHLLTALVRPPGCARIVRAGGLEEYGTGPLPYREDQREAPVSPYSASQVAATHLAQMLHRRAGLPVVTLRPALVYGPDQAASFFIPSLILACLARRAFDMSAGDQTRELVFVDDVIEAFIRAAISPSIEGQVINIGSGVESSIREVADLVRRLAGSDSPLRVGALSGRGAGLDRLVCDPARARDLLAWEARTPLADGLSRTIAWYRAAQDHERSSGS